jgi:cytochrome c biogenesis protein CcmG/thiol:disulfide interchange protein DsbE
VKHDEDSMTASSVTLTRPRVWLPVALFGALVVLLGVGLSLNPREVPSPLVGRPAPAFELPQLLDPTKTFSPKDMAGKVWLLNVWASWCTSCVEEHPVLSELAKSGAVPVYGLNYKDQRTDGTAWLRKLGDPFVLSAYDPNGRIGLDYGVYGTPETYLIDRQGVIRYKRIGPLTPQIIEQKILPLVTELNRG